MGKRRARPPRYFVYHCKKDGWLIDYVSPAYFQKDLIAKHEMVIKSLEDNGFKPATSSKEEDLGVCPDCTAPMKMSRAGKPYCSRVCWK